MRLKNRLNELPKLIASNPILIGILILTVLMAIFIPSFWTTTNLLTVAKQMSVNGIAATGLVFVLISGANDLSVGSNMMISGIAAAYCMTTAAPALGAVGGLVIGILVGIIIGLINGVVVAKIGVNPFIATICLQMLLDGLGVVWTNAQTIGGLPASFNNIGSSEYFGIPLPLIIMMIFYVVGQFVLKKTAFGRKLYATGANREATKLVGISATGMQIIAYIICGFCAAVAGLIAVARIQAASPASGTYTMLDALSAVIIGGASLFGGKGSVVGAAFGVVLLSVVQNGFNLLGVDYYTTMIAKGAIILLAIILDSFKEKSLFAASLSGIKKA